MTRPVSRRIIRQIEELKDGRRYAIVFNERLTGKELNELRTVCEGAHIQALILTNARVIPLGQLASVIGEAAADQVGEQLAAAAPGEMSVDIARLKAMADA